MQINLDRDSDFVAEVVSVTGDWPDGTGVEIRFDLPGVAPDIVWPATVDGASARWNVSKDDVADALDAEPKGVKMHYVTDINDLVWFKGASRDFT
jgi:hypothetical protein